MLNAVKSVLADVLGISPSSEQREHTPYGVQHIHNQPYVDTLYIISKQPTDTSEWSIWLNE